MDPYRNNYVYDMYVHDANMFDVIITKVFDDTEAVQLLNLIDIVHHNNLKLVVITKDVNYFKLIISENLDSYMLRNDKHRLFDRLRIILPGIFTDE